MQFGSTAAIDFAVGCGFDEKSLDASMCWALPSGEQRWAGTHELWRIRRTPALEAWQPIPLSRT